MRFMKSCVLVSITMLAPLGTLPSLLALTFTGLANAQAFLYHGAQQTLSDHLQVSPKAPLLSLHRQLVEIESITGNEHGVGEFLISYLEERNFTVEKQEIEISSGEESDRSSSSDASQSRFNLLAYPGSNRNTRILLSSHIDTVPPFWPYQIRGFEIWGRGGVDAKACVATQIIAVEELLATREISPGDVALLFVVGEETGGDGMRRASDLDLEWESVIFGEPTELKLAAGHKGLLGFKLKATGQAAHSGYPWLGESAISMILPALVKLENLQLPWSEKYGNTTLNIGQIEGGVAMNVMAESATAGIAMRLANGTAEQTKEIVLDAIREVDARLETTFQSVGYGPVDIAHEVDALSLVLFNLLAGVCK